MKINTVIKRIIPFIPLAIGIAGIIFVYFSNFYPTDIGIPCFLESVTKIKCPTCGGTRSVYYFLRFNFLLSMKYNFPVFLLAIFFCFIYFRFLYEYCFKKAITKYPVLPITITFVAILIVYWILRIIFPVISY